MVSATEIENEATFKEWLTARRPEVATAIAFRTAARVLPLVYHPSQNWAGENEDLLPPLLRCLVSAFLASRTSDGEMIAIANESRGHAVDAALAVEIDTPSGQAIAAARDAAVSAVPRRAVQVAVTGASRAQEAAALAEDSESSIWAEIQRDATEVEEGIDVHGRPLWSEPPPRWFNENWATTKVAWDGDPPIWGFWTRWYQSVLDGHPLSPATLRDIALIPDDVWKAGPGRVAEEIARIEELHSLRQRVAELQQQLERALDSVGAASPEVRAHNMPPELVDAPQDFLADVGAAQSAFEAAQNELAKPRPSRTRLRLIGRVLLAKATAALNYVGTLADTAAKSAAQELGKRAVQGGVLWVLLQDLMAFAESLLRNGLW